MSLSELKLSLEAMHRLFILLSQVYKFIREGLFLNDACQWVHSSGRFFIFFSVSDQWVHSSGTCFIFFSVSRPLSVNLRAFFLSS